MSFDVIDAVLSVAVERWAATDPDRICIISDDGAKVTYRELDRCASAVAIALRERGVGAGDRVATLVPNDIRSVYVMLGLAKIAAIEVPVNPALIGASLAHVLGDAEPAGLIVEVGRRSDVEAALPAGHRPVVIEVAPDDASPPADSDTLDAILAKTVDTIATSARGDDIASIMYTSGTTGLPKGAVLPHCAATRIGDRAATALSLDRDDTLIAVLPLFHGGGRYMNVGACLLMGARCLLVRKFSASKFWEQAREHGATAAHMVVSMAHFLVAQEPSIQDRTHQITRGLVVPAPQSLVDTFAERFGVPIFEMYGSTEIAIPILNSADDTAPPGSCGRPVAPYRVRILDAHDQVVPLGEVGEICVSCDDPWSMSSGYWNQPAMTLDVVRNFWFHTGDAGRMDDEGFVYYVDRFKDMIRRRGENISPRTVEDVVNALEGVTECAAYPVPSEYGEDEIAIAVVAHREPTIAEIAAACAEALPRFAVPRYVRFLDALPKTATAKIQKFKLKQEGVTDAVEIAQSTPEGAHR